MVEEVLGRARPRGQLRRGGTIVSGVHLTLASESAPRAPGRDRADGRGGYVPPAAASSSRAPAARARVPVTSGAPRTVSAASQSQLNELRAQLAEVAEHSQTVEKERDFYFDSTWILPRE